MENGSRLFVGERSKGRQRFVKWPFVLGDVFHETSKRTWPTFTVYLKKRLLLFGQGRDSRWNASSCRRSSVSFRSFNDGRSWRKVKLCESSWNVINGYLVDPASSHMLVSKIKPCMSAYKLFYDETANGSLNQLSFIWMWPLLDNRSNSRANTYIKSPFTRAVFIRYKANRGNPCGDS